MSDQQYGQEPETAMHEDQNLQAESGHAEAWQEDLPPQDDFHDTSSSSAGAGDVGGSSGFEPSGGGRKKGAAIFLSALVLGAAVVGGVVYYQFGAGQGAIADYTATAIDASSAPQNARAGVVSPSAQQEASVPGDMDLTALYKAVQGQAPTEAESAIPGAVNASDLAPPAAKTAGGGLQPPPLATTAAPVPSAALPVPAGEVKPSPKMDATAQVPETMALPASAPATQLSDLGGQVQELKTKVDNLQKMMERTAASNSSAIEERLSRLEQQLSSGAPTKASKEKSAVEELLNEPVQGASPTGSQAEKEAVSKTTAPVAVKKKVASKKPATPKKVVQKQDTSSWVLRAASPGKAWLSKGENTAELLQIQVGDILPGLGKVRAIRQEGDKWVVEGSKRAVR